MFNTISKKLANAGRGAVRGTQKLAGSVTLSAQIEESRKQIQNYFTQLGKACYERYRDHAAPEFQEICQAIALEEEDAFFCTECGCRLPEKESPSVPDGRKECPVCGNHVEDMALFCNVCGAKLEQEAYQEPLPLFTEAEETAEEPSVSSEAEEKEEDAEKDPDQTV